jgi:MraZ protein
MPEFTGTHTHTLDEKGRVSVPAVFRRQLTGEELYVNLGLDGCLVLYTPERWRRVREEIAGLSRGKTNQRFFMRRFARYLRGVSIDSQGRISLPADLREKAGIEEEVLFLGQFNSIELWAPERFERISAEDEYSFEQAAEDLGIDI